jgi:tetratricopeptide (TPR) repeat protein
MVPHEGGRPDLRGALEDARTATSLAPDVGSFHVTLGNVLDDLGRTDEALAAYDTAIELEPDMAYAYRNRSLARIRSGDSAGARDDLDRALELDPEYAEAYNDRAFDAVFDGDCDAALADADRALELDERSANGHAIRALCVDDPDEALDEAEAAIKLGRRDCWMYTVVGLIQAERGELAEAREALERALAIAPDDATADDVRQLIAELPEP